MAALENSEKKKRPAYKSFNAISLNKAPVYKRRNIKF